jgi:hypothetical protein
MPFIGDTGQLSNIYEKNHETTTLRIHEGDTAFQAYNPADSHYKLITTLQEITDIGNVTSNTLQFSNAITGFTTTSNVGIANSTPTHTLDVGSKAYIDENASNTFWTSGTLYADKVLSETTEITNSVTTRDVLADKFFPKTNGFIEVTSNVGVLNTAPVHTLDIGANVQIDEYGSNTFWTSGNVYSEHYKGPNVTVSGSVDTDQLIVNDINSKDTDFVNFTSNVGVLNTAPVHTLDIGANVQIDEYGSNTFWTSGNVHADKYTGSEIQLSGVIRATDFILAGGSQATPTPDLQTISEVLASGGGAPFSSDRTLTLSNATTSLDASVIQSITTKSNVIGNNVTAVTVNSNLIGNNVTAVTVNSNLIGNNVTAVTVNSNLIGNNVTAVTVNSNLIGNNVTAVTVNSNLIGNNVTAVTVNSNLIGNNVTAVTVNSNLIGNNVTAVTVNSNLIGNNVTAVTVNSNLIGNNVTAVTVNSNLIGNNVTAVTVNSNVIGNNVTAVTVNSNLIGNNVSASFISGNGDLISRKYSFGINGISAYTVIGPGFTTAANNPTLTLLRGQVYVFDNSTYYGSHPLQIRTSQGGTAYTNGVVDNGGGKLTFTVPMNAPIKLYYQCTNHSGMGNIIYIPLENLDTSQTLNLSNDLVVGTDKLVVDVSESRVGINKSTPTKTLDVTGEIACSSDLTVGGSVTATGTVSGSSSLTPGSYLTGSPYTGATNQTFNVDATDANTPNRVVARDASGNFSAGTITASMSTSLTPGSYLTGFDYNGGTARIFSVDATDANIPGKVVARDASGNFSAGTITASMSTSLTPGSYLTGFAYNGGTARIFSVDATDANTAGKVVARDASGNFGAGTITAALSGNATTATALQTARNINGVSFDGTGNITITANTPNTLTPGSYLTGSVYNGGTAQTFDVDATSANTANKVVARDGSGNFSAGTITANLSGVASSITNQANSATITASASAGNNTIVRRSSAGYIYANYFNTSPNDVSSGVSKVCVETNNDGFIRHGTSAAISSFLGLANSATTTSTNANTANTIVKRDASGDFSAGTITADLSGTATTATNQSGGTVSATTGYFSNYIYADGNKSIIRGESPTLYFRDTNHMSGMIHNNSNLLYILRGGTDTQDWSQINNQWPWIWDLSNNNATCGGSLYCVGNVTAYSDIRHKKDIVKLDDALEKVEKLNGYTYTRKDDGKRYTGLIAQEVLEVLPEAVIADEKGDYSLAYGNMVGLLVEAIKELKLEIDELKKSR